MRLVRLSIPVLALAALGLGALSFSPRGRLAVAKDNDNDNQLQAVPFTFVGTAPGCAPSPPGSRIVTSAWLPGLGLPDNSQTTMSSDPTVARDPHTGLLLSKNGPTPNCSAAGATIRGFRKGSTITEIGFDYRNGGHCGAGAPRFNITTTDSVTHFAGCAGGTPTASSQDPLEWTRVRFSGAQMYPPLVFGVDKVQSISIIFDEGTDATSASDPNGVGLATIDNIDINGTLITSGPSQSRDSNHREGHNDRGDDD